MELYFFQCRQCGSGSDSNLVGALNIRGLATSGSGLGRWVSGFDSRLGWRVSGFESRLGWWVSGFDTGLLSPAPSRCVPVWNVILGHHAIS